MYVCVCVVRGVKQKIQSLKLSDGNNKIGNIVLSQSKIRF